MLFDISDDSLYPEFFILLEKKNFQCRVYRYMFNFIILIKQKV